MEKKSQEAFWTRKSWEQLILENISTHKKTGNWNTQHEFTKARCLSSLIAIYDKMTGLIVEGKTVDFVCLDISKDIDTVSHKNFIDKVLTYGMDED